MYRLQHGDVTEESSINPKWGALRSDALVYGVSCSLAPKILKLFGEVQFYKSLFLIFAVVICAMWGKKPHRWMCFVIWCIYLFIYILLLLMFFNSFLHLHTPHAWWTVNETYLLEFAADLSQVFRKKWSFLAQHFLQRFSHEWLQVV